MESTLDIENPTDTLILMDAAGRVLYAAACCADLFGFAANELVGRNVLHLIHPADRKRSRRAMKAVIAKPIQTHRIDLRVRHGTLGWCLMESTIANFLHQTQIGAIVIVCRDLRAGATAEEQYQHETREMLRSITRLEDCLHAVAHDFREPLRTISSFSNLLIRNGQLDAKATQYAQFILDGIRRMSAIFEEIHTSAIGRRDPDLRPVDLGHVVAEVLLDLKQAISTGRATVITYSLPLVLGNEKQLIRVFQNLIANAIKYCSQPPVKIQIGAERLGGVWIVKVRDNGPGIARENHERIFRLSERLHGPDISGNGIGLAICRTIIETMGGSIWVESDPGFGSVFCFTIAATGGTGLDTVGLERGGKHAVPQPSIEVSSVTNGARRHALPGAAVET